MQMQLQLMGESSSSILRKPDQLLAFIKQVLESTTSQSADEVIESAIPKVNRLDIADIGGKDSDDEEYDSDDDDPTSEVIKPDDEMVETTINLLLSILESEWTRPWRVFLLSDQPNSQSTRLCHPEIRPF